MEGEGCSGDTGEEIGVALMKNTDIKVVKACVTKRDIAIGRHNGDSCPIALAIKRATKGDGIHVDAWGSCFFERKPDGIIWWQVDLTKKAQLFVTRFDGDKKVRPQCFKLVFKR